MSFGTATIVAATAIMTGPVALAIGGLVVMGTGTAVSAR
jgi:hypothetical protein